MLSLILSAGPLPNAKKIYLQLSVWTDGLLSTPKTITFQVKSLPWLYSPSLSKAIPWPLQINFLLIAFLVYFTNNILM